MAAAVRLTFPDAWEKAERIQGWLGRGEAKLLYDLCDGPWCEIGSWKGRSTTVLANTGYRGYAVDHFKGSPEHPESTDTYEEFVWNVGGYRNVTVLPFKFRAAAPFVPDGLRLLFLDADHSYEQTKLAFDLYESKLAPFGHVVFHDARGDGWPGVERVVAEMPWAHAATVEQSIAFQKPKS